MKSLFNRVLAPIFISGMFLAGCKNDNGEIIKELAIENSELKNKVEQDSIVYSNLEKDYSELCESQDQDSIVY